MIDIEKLKALAEAVRDGRDGSDAYYEALHDYGMAFSPAAVLELIGKVESLREVLAATRNARDANTCRVDELKAENESLRKDAERYRWLRDSSESAHQFYLSPPIWFTGVKFSKENVDRTIDAALSDISNNKHGQ